MSVSYNPLERREACKGGKETGKRTAASHASTKSSTAATKSHPTQSSRKADVSSVNSANQAAKAQPVSNQGVVYDEQVRSLYSSLRPFVWD